MIIKLHKLIRSYGFTKLNLLLVLFLFSGLASAYAQCSNLTVTTTAADCPDNGSAQIDQVDPSYTYRLIGGPANYPTAINNNGTFASLEAGEYTFEIIGCPGGNVTGTFTIANNYPTYSVASATVVTGTLCSIDTPTGAQLRGVVTGGKAPYAYDFVKLVDGVPVSSAAYGTPVTSTEYLESVTEFGVYRFYARDACGEIRTTDVSVLAPGVPATSVALSGPFYSVANCGSTTIDGVPATFVQLFLHAANGDRIVWTEMQGGKIEMYTPVGDVVPATGMSCGVATDRLLETFTDFSQPGYGITMPQKDVILRVYPPCGTPFDYCIKFTNIVPPNVGASILVPSSCDHPTFEEQTYTFWARIHSGQLPYQVIIRDKDGNEYFSGTQTTEMHEYTNIPHSILPITFEVIDHCGVPASRVIPIPAASASIPITGTIYSDGSCLTQAGTVSRKLVDLRGYTPGLANTTVSISGGPLTVSPMIVKSPHYPLDYYLLNLVVGYDYLITWTTTCGTTYTFPFSVTQTPGTQTPLELNVSAAVDALCGQNAANVIVNHGSNLTGGIAGHRYFTLTNLETGVEYERNRTGTFSNVPPGDYKSGWFSSWRSDNLGFCPIDTVQAYTTVTVLGDGVDQKITRKTLLFCEDGTGVATNNGKAIIEVNGAPPFTYEIIRRSVLEADPSTTAWVTSASNVTSNTYSWDLPQAGDPINTEYVLRSVDKCENKITTQASLQPLAPPTFESTMMPCIGTQNYRMSVTAYAGAFEYKWVKLSDPETVLSTTNSLTLAGAYTQELDGTYRCYVTLDGCIERYVDRTLTSTVPSFTVESDEVCVGANIVMSASGGSTYSWTGPNGFTSSDASVSIANATEAMTGTYSVTIVNEEGCSLTSDTLITVEPCVPVCVTPEPPTLTGTTEICLGTTATLEGECQTGQIRWYINAALSEEITNLDVQPTTNTTYYAVCRLAEDCVSDYVTVSTILCEPVCTYASEFDVSKVLMFNGTISSSDGDVLEHPELSRTYSMVLALDANSFLVASSGNQKVLRFEKATGEFIEEVISGPPSGAVESGSVPAIIKGPHGMAWGPDGNLYVSWGGYDRIDRYSPSGTHLGKVVDIVIPWLSLQFGVDGALYAGSSFDAGNSYVKKITDPTSATPAMANFTATLGAGQVQDLNFGPDGKLYVVFQNSGGDQLRRYNSITGAYEATLVTAPAFGMGSVQFGPDNKMYVGLVDEVRRYELDGTDLGQSAEADGIVKRVAWFAGECPVPCVAPNPTVSGEATICVGEEATLEATGCTTGFTYLWSNGATEATITVSPTATTTYTVECINTENSECKSVTPGEAEVTVNQKTGIPTGITATPAEVIIGGESVLTATCAEGTPSWFEDEDLTTPLESTTVKPTLNTTYYVICGTDKDCVEVGEVSVTVTDAPCVAPNPTVTGEATICVGEEATLEATGCTTGFTYLWSNGATEATITVSPTATTTYTVECINTEDSECKSATPGEAEVTVNQKTAAPTEATATPAEIISGEESVLTATCAEGTPSWFEDEDLTTPLESTTVKPTVNTTYYVICGTDKDCAEVAEVTVTVTDAPCVAPNPTVTGEATICVGEEATLEATGCTTGFTYLWSNGATEATITVSPTATTTYTVECINTEDSECKSVTPGEAEVTVNQKTAAPTEATATPAEIIAGEESVLTATCAEGLTPSWFTDEALITPLTSTTVTPEVPTTYFVICGTDKQCAEVAEVTVNAIDAPKVFDLALKKLLKDGRKNPVVKIGDTVTFTITVYNQGTVDASNIQVVDYIPTGLTLADNNWTIIGDKAYLNTPLEALAAQKDTTIEITFVVNESANGQVVNIAEISSADNEFGLDDKDSTPDDDKDNDGNVKDDITDEDGKNNPGVDDEDDHDIEIINICPNGNCLQVKTSRVK